MKFKKGDKVVCVGAFYGRGGVSLGEIGVIVDRITTKDYTVSFPNHSEWRATEGDIILAKEHKVKRLLEKLNEA